MRYKLKILEWKKHVHTIKKKTHKNRKACVAIITSDEMNLTTESIKKIYREQYIMRKGSILRKT